MTKPMPYQYTSPTRTPEATARLAWLIVGIASICCLLVCGLAGYGVWRFRASIMGSQEGNMLKAFAAPVSLIHPGRVEAVAVPVGQPVPVREGETVQVGSSLRPGTHALVTLWDGSTLWVYPNTRVTFTRLQSTLYSSRFQEVILDLSAGQVLLGEAQLGRYQRAHFAVRTPQAVVELEPGGTYLFRVRDYSELAVRQGQARVTVGPSTPPTVVDDGQKAVVRPGEPPVLEVARWQLLRGADFAQGALGGWTFRIDQAGDGGTVDPTWRSEQYTIGGKSVWAVGLERKGGLEDRAQAILFQQMEEDLSVYRSARLELDLRINYQSLPGGGPLGVDYPINVRIRYRDTEGENREYTFGFYDHTEKAVQTDFPSSVPGETFLVPHYRWEHVSLELLGLQPRPAVLTEVQLFASGNDYLSWVANVSLVAE